MRRLGLGTSSASRSGVLVLSRLAGAAEDLAQAVLVNPYLATDTAQGLARALEMTGKERRQRHAALLARVLRNTAASWVGGFLQSLEGAATRATAANGAAPRIGRAEADTVGVRPSPTMTSVRPFPILRGRILCYRLFDVGGGIDLGRAEALFADTLGHRRAVLTREGAQSLVIAAPPLHVALGRRSLQLPKASSATDFAVSMRLFAYGAASLLFEKEIAPRTPLLELVALCDELYESTTLDTAARAELETVLPRLAPAIADCRLWGSAETYTVIFIEELDGHPSGLEVRNHGGIEQLLLGETGAKPVAASERADVLQHAYSYLEDDLAVIDWNSAFVLEPSGSRDIPDLLELATSQLLEMRYYDAQLDEELARMHAGVARARPTTLALLGSPYARVARHVLTRYLELTELTERVDNALKVVGDFYLARVYQGALNRFRVAAWRESVDRKQELLARACSLLNSEVWARRGVLLEAAIVLLIVLELLLPLLRLL